MFDQFSYTFHERLISGVNNLANTDSVQCLSGKLSDHFAFKVNADGKVEVGDKINSSLQ